MCRARSIRPRAAVFTPAAPTPSIAVAPRSPNCEQCQTGSSSRATCTICRRRKILWLQLAGTEASVASAAPFFKILQRRSGSILPRFVPGLPLERNDRHRVVRRGHRLPRSAIRQAGRRPLRTKCLTDLDRSKAQEPDRLSVVRLGDPPDHARCRGSPPLDIPRRLHGRERDHAAPRYTPPALQSRTHLRETPNRQARHR